MNHTDFLYSRRGRLSLRVRSRVRVSVGAGWSVGERVYPLGLRSHRSAIECIRLAALVMAVGVVQIDR